MLVSITIPKTVLISAIASAPAATTSCAISTILVTSGVSFAIIGNSPPILRRTASIAALAVAGWHAKTCPLFSTLGQEIFTSSAANPVTARSLRASTA